MAERFFLETPPRDGRATLVGDEARHLARVMRARVGDEVVVFAGTGAEWPARVTTIARDTVELETGPARTDPPRDGPRLTLAVALPKGDRQKWLVEKLTELGVDRLVPLETERGVAVATPAALERLRRTVVEACKQCGRNTLLEIGSPTDIAGLVERRTAAVRLLLAAPGAEPFTAACLEACAAAEIVGCVGPEGGFTTEETAALAAAGAQPVRLGAYILRVETAALALAAAWSAGS
jgi:16S rRNA (uracil1498-N3)-methyltransferase